MSNLFTLLYVFLGAVAAAASRAVMAVVAAHEQPVELSIAQLAVRLVLAWPYMAIAELHSGNHGRVQRVDVHV